MLIFVHVGVTTILSSFSMLCVRC